MPSAHGQQRVVSTRSAASDGSTTDRSSTLRLTFMSRLQACRILNDLVEPFSLTECQANFCPLGVDAYQLFVRQMVHFIQVA